MFTMIVKMSAMTLVYVAVTFLLYKVTQDKKLEIGKKIAIGVVYGIMCVFSTHCGIDYSDMLINVRDLGPMSAGLFFDPVSGIIAGILGGIERYIAGTYFGVGSYTCIACSLSTCLAGFVAAFLRVYIFKRKRPSTVYAFFMGAVIEVFHMYVVFLSHRTDMEMAFYVVKTCSVPMIIFSGIGLSLTTLAIKKSEGELHNPFTPIPRKEVPVSNRFQVWLFGVTIALLLTSFGFSYDMHSQSALQEAKAELKSSATDIADTFEHILERGGTGKSLSLHVGTTGTFCIVNENGEFITGTEYDKYFNQDISDLIAAHKDGKFFEAEIYGEESLCFIKRSDNDLRVFTQIPMSEVYESRDARAYETMLADILIFTVIYVLISLLVQSIVVDNLIKVNKSLGKITEGDLEEMVNVYESSEFASLSDDINQTVSVLKGYIAAAEKRIEQELLLAHTIQDSALPKNFNFSHDGFDVHATMDPAKEVGGDFYDIFFVDTDMLAMVIADVSGKGIPAALLMMRSKTAIRSLAETGNDLTEVFERVNNELCEGNELNMFVTVWMGIIDLKNGNMKCMNAGHEYPALMRDGRDFKLFRDRHNPPLGAVEGLKFKGYEMKLDPGDVLYVYTDGIPEAINKKEEQYGTERMLTVLSAFADRSMEELLHAVSSDVEVFKGEEEQFDDITMIGFRYKD